MRIEWSASIDKAVQYEKIALAKLAQKEAEDAGDDEMVAHFDEKISAVRALQAAQASPSVRVVTLKG